MGRLLRPECTEGRDVGSRGVTAFAIIDAVPLRSALIAEAASAVQQGATKRAAGIAIYDRYFGSKFEDDDKVRREDRLRDIAKALRTRLKSGEEYPQL